MRLSFYKRIAGAESKQELDDLKVELIDFGLLPEPAKNLLKVAEIRLSAKKSLLMTKIDFTAQGGFIGI